MKPLLIMLLLTSAIFVRGQSRLVKLQAEVDQLKENVRALSIARSNDIERSIRVQEMLQGRIIYLELRISEIDRRIDTCNGRIRQIRQNMIYEWEMPDGWRRQKGSPQISQYDSSKSGMDIHDLRFRDDHVEIPSRQDLFIRSQARPY